MTNGKRCYCDPEIGVLCPIHWPPDVNDAPGIVTSQYTPATFDMSGTFTVKDSGDRTQFASGMVRDTTAAKIDYSLCLDGPLMERLAAHLTKGAQKYAARNWMLATGQEELERFRTSAARHFMQWWRGDQDEDHFAAVVFNLNGAEYVRERMKR